MSEPCVRSLAELPTILDQEEEESYRRALQVLDLDLTVAIQNGAGGIEHFHIRYAYAKTAMLAKFNSPAH